MSLSFSFSIFMSFVFFLHSVTELLETMSYSNVNQFHNFGSCIFFDTLNPLTNDFEYECARDTPVEVDAFNPSFSFHSNNLLISQFGTDSIWPTIFIIRTWSSAGSEDHVPYSSYKTRVQRNCKNGRIDKTKNPSLISLLVFSRRSCLFVYFSAQQNRAIGIPGNLFASTIWNSKK